MELGARLDRSALRIGYYKIVLSWRGWPDMILQTVIAEVRPLPDLCRILEMLWNASIC
jgi:hypothetical protein